MLGMMKHLNPWTAFAARSRFMSRWATWLRSRHWQTGYRPPVSHGGAAVDVFFVLSGLVITQSLDRLHGE